MKIVLACLTRLVLEIRLVLLLSSCIYLCRLDKGMMGEMGEEGAMDQRTRF
jgi:hypothetical protein